MVLGRKRWTEKGKDLPDISLSFSLNISFFSLYRYLRRK